MEAAADEGRVSAVARVVKSTYVFDAGAWVPRRGASLTTAELRAVPAQIGLPLVVTAHLPETLSAGGAARQPLLAPDPPDVISGAPNLPVVNGGALAFTRGVAVRRPRRGGAAGRRRLRRLLARAGRRHRDDHPGQRAPPAASTWCSC